MIEKSYINLKLGHHRITILDPALINQILGEAENSMQREYPPRLPEFPEHRYHFYDNDAYIRPKVDTTTVACKVLQQYFGITFPVAMAFTGDRKSERFVFLDARFEHQYNITFTFRGYRLHSNGMLTDPAYRYADNFSYDSVNKRTLLGKWVECLPIKDGELA